MTSMQSAQDFDHQNGLEWRLYTGMLTTRLFEDALIRWEHEGKISAQTFPSKGQEAIAIGCCLALERGDAVIPSFRTRGAMVAMGITIVEQLREFVHSPLAAGGSRDAPHHASWPERGVMPGSTMIGGHLAMAAGLALAMQLEQKGEVSLAFFGDGTLGSGDLHETMHIAGMSRLPLILVCENNGWEMATPWQKVRKTQSLIPYAEPFGFATRSIDGNDALEVYNAARWARATASNGQPVFLDCMTFRAGLYSSHFGEVRGNVEKDLATWEQRDPLKRMAEWLMGHGLASAEELQRLTRQEEEGIEAAFNTVRSEG
ncbi:MAG: thiamine pyrophosphate-dependent dehydrogenase E1 component subunit alpha [Deltaproteobacteria bacterium]|nr:thiamine pyrophosphate-dependent dehydrogenase E1 component subunit alpha [Deltaproteobacteria bacterium]MBI2366927.1 thiamine pyrophosphate-dependent dehydrogenase E1 component subunit alpha [Deltaproteobacteria bacterium]MBI2530676.1 thiamine pyrophosphate-dependent dehydrogenase E1 component subunit alpha [Deltaproteobacteria bacterium]